MKFGLGKNAMWWNWSVFTWIRIKKGRKANSRNFHLIDGESPYIHLYFRKYLDITSRKEMQKGIFLEALRDVGCVTRIICEVCSHSSPLSYESILSNSESNSGLFSAPHSLSSSYLGGRLNWKPVMYLCSLMALKINGLHPLLSDFLLSYLSPGLNRV